MGCRGKSLLVGLPNLVSSNVSCLALASHIAQPRNYKVNGIEPAHYPGAAGPGMEAFVQSA